MDLIQAIHVHHFSGRSLLNCIAMLQNRSTQRKGTGCHGRLCKGRLACRNPHQHVAPAPWMSRRLSSFALGAECVSEIWPCNHPMPPFCGGVLHPCTTYFFMFTRGTGFDPQPYGKKQCPPQNVFPENWKASKGSWPRGQSDQMPREQGYI